jgi:hypothetical protein
MSKCTGITGERAVERGELLFIPLMEEKTDLFREETDPGAAAAFSGSRVLPIR